MAIRQFCAVKLPRYYIQSSEGLSHVPLIDSKADTITHDYSVDELIERANYMRGLNLLSLCSAGSGHSGGTLGIMDVAAALYLKIARHDPGDPFWPDRDRVVWSAGHKAPALYVSLAVSGYFPEHDLMKLRMLGSPLQGHPHWRDLPGVEISSTEGVGAIRGRRCYRRAIAG